MAEFHKLPADQQVDMFLHAMYREPPAYQYCDYLAMSGERVVLSILARLQEDNDYTKSALAAVLARMQRKRYYDLTTHPDILARLESECAKAKDKEYRNECENYVQEILGDK